VALNLLNKPLLENIYSLPIAKECPHMPSNSISSKGAVFFLF
jgi:hypothetical protein